MKGRRLTFWPRSQFNAAHAEDCIYPQALYEVAAQQWTLCCNPPFQAGDNKDTLPGSVRDLLKDLSSGNDNMVTAADVDAYQRLKTEECEKYLTRVRNYGSYCLDARVGMKVQSGFETLKWWKAKKGWAT